MSLLSADDPPAVEVVNAGGSSALVLLCDHASNRLPRQLGDLGLTAGQLADHISWDPGAAEVARRISQRLDAPLVLSGYSRLVIDCNRPLDNDTLIAKNSAGVMVMGNQSLTDEDRQARINELYQPYHQAIAGLLNDRKQRPSVVISIHSFTPVLNGETRPWQMGICYGHDNRLASLMLKQFNKLEGFVVGDNQPYSIEHGIDYTLPFHAERRGLPHLMIEIRQDLIKTEEHVEFWADKISDACQSIEDEVLLWFAKTVESNS